MMIKKIKFAVIFNSNAGSYKRLKLVDKVLELIKKDHEVELFETNSEKEAKLVFKDLLKKNFDKLVIAGGDGSISFAINEIINNDLGEKLLGYIPVGTANILQSETQITKKAYEIYKVLISDKYKKVSLVKINNRYFFLMVGIGFDSKIVGSINPKVKKYLGKVIFVYKALEHFLFLKNEKVEIEIENEKIIADWVLCTNSKYYAGPYSITNETNIFENKIVMFIFKDLTRIDLLYYIWLVITKGDLGGAKNIVKRNLVTTKINGINSNVLSQVDGENFGYQKSLKIQKTEKSINLLVP